MLPSKFIIKRVPPSHAGKSKLMKDIKNNGDKSIIINFKTFIGNSENLAVYAYINLNSTEVYLCGI